MTRRQLAELGLGREAIGRRVRARRLNRLYGGVYAVGHRVLSREDRWLAAVLSRCPEAVLSHRSAAALWGIRDHHGGLIDIASPRKARSQGAIRAHHLMLPPDEVMTASGPDSA
ncbi:MAG: hypothetical protein JJE35_06785 [Thermoleophilia bacterium]|nr:hypothetical protein [Thermoleophilia bacterium]